MKIEFYDKMLLRNLEQHINGDTIHPYDFPTNVNIAFDRINVHRDNNNGVVLYIPEGVGSDYLKVWHQGLPQILIKDIRKQRLDRYYEFITPEIKSLIRTLTDDEYEVCSKDPMLAPYLISKGDLKFIIIKIVKVDDGYYKASRALDDYYPDENELPSDSDEEVEEEEPVEEEGLKSYSLFDD